MSHFTTLEIQIRDAAALRESCRELGANGSRTLGNRREAGSVVHRALTERWVCQQGLHLGMHTM